MRCGGKYQPFSQLTTIFSFRNMVMPCAEKMSEDLRLQISGIEERAVSSDVQVEVQDLYEQLSFGLDQTFHTVFVPPASQAAYEDKVRAERASLSSPQHRESTTVFAENKFRRQRDKAAWNLLHPLIPK